MKNSTSENRRAFISCASKIIHEWSGRQEIFSRPHVIENCWQYLLLRTDILQKTVVGCPCQYYTYFSCLALLVAL